MANKNFEVKEHKGAERIILSNKPENPGKIPASLAAIASGLVPARGNNCQLSVWARCVKLYDAGVKNNEMIRAGEVIEPKAIEYLQSLNPNVQPASEYFQVDHYNFFDESSVFSGIPDAIDAMNGILYEVKVAFKYAPALNFGHAAQAALYAKEINDNPNYPNIKQIYIVYVDLSGNEQFKVNPSLFEVTAENIHIDRYDYYNLVADINIKELINKCELFYYKHVANGISPALNRTAAYHKALLTVLERRSVAIESDEVAAAAKFVADHYAELQKLNQLKAKVDSRCSVIKKSVIPAMDDCETSVEFTAANVRFTVSRYETETIDKELLKNKYPEIYAEVLTAKPGERINKTPIATNRAESVRV